MYYHKYMKYKQKYMALKGAGDNDHTHKYEIHLQEPWFSLVKDGTKKVEGRPNKGLFAQLNIGDTIIFFNMDKTTRQKRSFTCKVVDKKTYDSFEEMLETEGLENVLPIRSVRTINDGVSVYRQWYDEKVEKQFGVIAIHIQIHNSV